MGREKSKKRHRHSHHSRHDDTDSDSDDYSSSSESDSDSSSYSDSSETSSSEEERRRRKAKKARRSSEGSSKHRRHSSKMKHKSAKKQKITKTKAKKSKKPEKIDIEEISMDDYFKKSAEFRTWLSKEKGIFFSDLSSEESRKLFKKFAEKWNEGSLEKSYYRGIQSSAVGHDAQSNYQWKFASKVSPADLKTLRASVSEWSSSKDNFDFSARSEAGSSSGGRRESHSSDPSHSGVGPSPRSKDARRVMGPSRGPDHDRGTFEREERWDRDRAHLKTERRDFRKQQEMVLDELLPKATGRDARVEKKRVRAEQRREREVSPDINDSKVYGTSANSIRDKVKARQEQRHSRAQAAVQKISDYQAKEKARMEAVMQMARANKKEGALW